MVTQLYGFNWEIYAKRIMPAFMNWLIEHNEVTIQQFYAQTRCAREEANMPAVMRQLQTWTRAQAFIKQLPHGPHASREYLKLCSAEQFTLLSDRYVYHHPPQLHQNYDALRALWGAIVEEYCLSWLPLANEDQQEEETDATITSSGNLLIERGELIELLNAANLKWLAQEVQRAEQPANIATSYKGASISNFSVDLVVSDTEHDLADGEEAIDGFPGENNDEDNTSLPDKESRRVGPEGILLGRHPATLYMRGWLATISVRAMALFELLACGRRSMPFGYRAREPFEAYIGYLTPDEVWQLALCLRNVQPPQSSEAETQSRLFRQQPTTHPDTFRMRDETPPAHADAFLKAVRAAASQNQGLICEVQ